MRAINVQSPCQYRCCGCFSTNTFQSGGCQHPHFFGNTSSSALRKRKNECQKILHLLGKIIPSTHTFKFPTGAQNVKTLRLEYWTFWSVFKVCVGSGLGPKSPDLIFLEILDFFRLDLFRTPSQNNLLNLSFKREYESHKKLALKGVQKCCKGAYAMKPILINCPNTFFNILLSRADISCRIGPQL